MKNWTIRRRIQAGFAAVVAVTALIVAFTAWRLAAILKLADAPANEAIRTCAQSALIWVLACLAGGIVLSLFVAISVSRSVNAPLGKLLALFEELRQGDFAKRLALGARDEFGALGAGINRTLDDLMELVGRVQKSGIQVNTSVTEIAAAAKEQQTTASQIAATTSEISATSKEISATAKELVRTMGEVTGVAEETASLASTGQVGLSRMGETVQQIVSAASAISAKLAVVNEKAGNINQVVSTISKVADQTNLLSLNAAIEAEKAGEYGRGFAVVATEIRRLADQTAVATYDIEQTVKEMQSAVAAGVMGMDKFSEEVRRGVADVRDASSQLTQIIQQVQTLTPRFEAVNDGMQAQAAGAQQISEALAQLGESARQTADSLRQSNQALEQLNEASRGLQAAIERIKL